MMTNVWGASRKEVYLKPNTSQFIQCKNGTAQVCAMLNGLCVRAYIVQGRTSSSACHDGPAFLTVLQKDTVILPGMEGLFGVKANHVPVISQLKPGVVELHSGSEVEKYFISGGWAYVHPDGVIDIQALEAVTLDQVDHSAVKSALSAASSATATDEHDAAVNRTAVELYSALDAAMEQKA